MPKPKSGKNTIQKSYVYSKNLDTNLCKLAQKYGVTKNRVVSVGLEFWCKFAGETDCSSLFEKKK